MCIASTKSRVSLAELLLQIMPNNYLRTEVGCKHSAATLASKFAVDHSLEQPFRCCPSRLSTKTHRTRETTTKTSRQRTNGEVLFTCMHFVPTKIGSAFLFQQRLPGDSFFPRIRRFIQRYGTHYIARATYGGRRRQAKLLRWPTF